MAMFPSGAAMLLPGLLVQAQRRGIQIDGRDVDQPAAHALKLLDDYDIVVIHRDERSTVSRGPRTDTHPLLREPIDVIFPSSHRLAQLRHVRASDVAGEEWICVEEGFMIDDVLRSLVAASGISAHVVQRVNDFRVTERLVAAGLGIAMMPRFSAVDPGLVRRPVVGFTAARSIDAVVRTGGSRRPKMSVVLQLLAEIAETLTTVSDRTSLGARLDSRP